MKGIEKCTKWIHRAPNDIWKSDYACNKNHDHTKTFRQRNAKNIFETLTDNIYKCIYEGEHMNSIEQTVSMHSNYAHASEIQMMSKCSYS